MKRTAREWLIRVIILMAGLTVAHFGVTLFLIAELGSDPFNVMIQGLFRNIPWPEGWAVIHGTVHIAVSLLIILVLLALDRRLRQGLEA